MVQNWNWVPILQHALQPERCVCLPFCLLEGLELKGVLGFFFMYRVLRVNENKQGKCVDSILLFRTAGNVTSTLWKMC